MILIHCHAAPLRTGMPNPKTFDRWPALVPLLPQPIVQIGSASEDRYVDDFRADLPLSEIRQLVVACDFWVSVDSFLPHLAHHIPKPGVVIWSKSDPTHFGYPENLNLLKSRSYLRPRQFRIWDEESFDPGAFMDPAAIATAIVDWRACATVGAVAAGGSDAIGTTVHP